MAGRSGTVNINVFVAPEQAEAGLKRVEHALASLGVTGAAASSKLGSKLQAAGSSITSAGKTMTKWVTLPLLVAGGASIKLAKDFQESMNHLQGLVGLSSSQVAGLSKQVLALAQTVPVGPKPLADALYFVTSAGLRGKAAMDVLAASAKASAAGLGDTATIADAVTSAVNAYGASNITAAHATDVLIATAREGKVAADSIAATLGKVIAPAQTLGLSFEQVGAAIASMTRQGLDAAASTTSLRQIFMTMIKPAKQTQEEYKKIGLSADQVRQSLKERGLLATLETLRQKVGTNKDALGKLFPNVRALNGFLILTGASAKKNEGIFNDLAHSTGTLDKSFKAASQTASFKFKQAMSDLQVAGVKAGSVMLPIFTSIVNAVGGLAEKFNSLPGAAQTTVLIGAAILGALGPGLRIVGGLTTGIGKLISAISAAGAEEGVIASLGAGLSALGINPIGAAVIGGLAVLGGAIAWITSSLHQVDQAFLASQFQAQSWAGILNSTAAAARGLKDAQLGLAGSKLSVRETANSIQLAIQNYKSLKASGHATAAELKGAWLAITRAQLDHVQAVQQEHSQESALNTERQKSKASHQEMIQNLKDEVSRFRNGSAAVLTYIQGVNAVPASMERLISKIKEAGLPAKTLNSILAGLPRDIRINIETILHNPVRGLGVTPSLKNAQAGYPSTAGKPGPAAGAHVLAGNVYRINERGTEAFIPDAPGTILPHGFRMQPVVHVHVPRERRSARPMHVEFHIYAADDPQETAEHILHRWNREFELRERTG